MKTVSEVYSQILNLYKDPTRFTTGHYQRDKDGVPCGWREGYCFCALGAVCYFTNIDNDGDAYLTDASGQKYHLQHVAACLLQRVSESLYGTVIQDVNDNFGLEKVVDVLQYAQKLWEGHTPTAEDLSTPVNNLSFYNK